MANSDVLVRMKADTQNYDANIAKARRTLEGFKQDNLTLGGIINQTTRSLTAAAAGFASLAAAAATIKNVVDESLQLAKAGEGIRLAFERLNRPDLLNGLRDATHKTVNDIELMKAAVKFNDFKLPVEELGTMLAFAQQKAKDTGQSVDYMVDSIVTGLGRKSLMILDNLGLSATEIRDKMKETGDMTKAVGEIIREQMANAGEYVETAADRATQANVELQNAMERLGETFQPLADTARSVWNDIKVGAIDLLNSAIKPLVEWLTKAGQLKAEVERLGGNAKVNRDIAKLKGSNYKPQAYQMMLSGYFRSENAARNNLLKAEKGGMGSIEIWQNRYEAAKSLREMFQSEGLKVLNPATTPPPVETTPTGGGSGSGFNAAIAAFMGGAGFKAEDTMPSVWAMLGDTGLRQVTGMGRKQNDLGRVLKDYVNSEENKKQEITTADMLEGVETMTGSLQGILDGVQRLGIEIPSELNNIFGVIQTIASIVSAIQTMQTVGSFLGIFANGGMAHAANGLLTGTHYSNDMVPVAVNDGELILNRAQQGNLASQLQGGMGAMQLSAVITAEQLRLLLQNNGKRTGRGEYVTTNFR
jgi:hypothetical protein